MLGRVTRAFESPWAWDLSIGHYHSFEKLVFIQETHGNFLWADMSYWRRVHEKIWKFKRALISWNSFQSAFCKLILDAPTERDKGGETSNWNIENKGSSAMQNNEDGCSCSWNGNTWRIENLRRYGTNSWRHSLCHWGGQGGQCLFYFVL